MKMMALLAAILLSACAAQTPNQRFYEAVSDYTTLQTVAVSYKQQCNDGLLPDNCEKVVKDIKTVDKQANEVIQSAKSNTDQPNYMAASYQALTALYGQLANLLRGD